MKIDWKHLATTTGYKSLKAAYAQDVKSESRGKAESIRKFIWVIGRAKHYAIHTGKSVELILNEWEEKRSYWWINFYQDCNQPKFRLNKNKPLITNKASKKVKPRWPLWKKEQAARNAKYN